MTAIQSTTTASTAKMPPARLRIAGASAYGPIWAPNDLRTLLDLD